MTKLLIENGTVLTMDRKNTIHDLGWVWVKEDRIGAVGPGQPPGDLVSHAERAIDATHMAVLPGLVNGHDQRAGRAEPGRDIGRRR